MISSGLEVPELRSEYGENFLIVVPGIRPVENDEADDQKRTVDVETAFRNGADYVVVGRPIRQAADPRTLRLIFRSASRTSFANNELDQALMAFSVSM